MQDEIADILAGLIDDSERIRKLDRDHVSAVAQVQVEKIAEIYLGEYDYTRPEGEV